MDRRIKQRRAYVLRAMRRKRSMLILGPILALVMVGGAYGLVESPLMAMSEITTVGGAPSTSVSVTASLRSYLGGSAVFARPSAMAATIARDVPVVRRAFVSVSPFGLVRVRIVPRIAAATVEVNPQRWLAVDRTGVVLAVMASRPSLPMVCPMVPATTPQERCSVASPSLVVGARLGANYSQALSVVGILSRGTTAKFPEVGVSSNGNVVLLDGLGDACTMGNGSSLSVKVHLCEQMVVAPQGSAHVLVDVSIPALPTLSYLP